MLCIPEDKKFKWSLKAQRNLLTEGEMLVRWYCAQIKNDRECELAIVENNYQQLRVIYNCLFHGHDPAKQKILTQEDTSVVRVQPGRQAFLLASTIPD